jgi:metal-responsive CopG/Arc/MetJ family transcriptional regulator
MTDISKYKNVSLSKDTYTKIDRLRKIIVPNTIISRSQTVNILVNEKLNGKENKEKEKNV